MSVRLGAPVASPVSSITNFAATGTTLTVNLVNSWAAPVPGDLVIAVVSYLVASTTDPTASFEGSAMTMVGSRQAFGTNRHMAVFRALVTNLGPSLGGVTFTFPASVSFAEGFAITVAGQDTSTPLDVSVYQSSLGANTSHAYGSITPVTSDTLLLGFLATDNDNGAGASTISDTATGWSVLANGGSLSGSDGSIAGWYRSVSTPAATSLTATTGASVNSACFLLAIRPTVPQDALDKVLLSRSVTARGPNASGGFTAAPGTFLGIQRDALVDSTDTVVIVFATRDSPAASLALSDSTGWTTIRDTQDAGGMSLQVYSKPYTTGMTLPSVTTGATTDRFWCFALVLRDLDTTDPFDTDAVSFEVAAGGTTATFPDATAAGNNVLLRMHFAHDDNLQYCTTQGDDGSQVWVNASMSGFSTSTGLDQSLNILARTVPTSGAVGTESVTLGGTAVAYTAYTLLLNRVTTSASLNPDPVSSSDVVVALQALDAPAGLSVAAAATADVSLDVETFQPYTRRGRRAFLWHTGADGQRTGVVS